MGRSAPSSRSRSASSDRASSIAKNGLPPETSWTRRSVARGNDVPRDRTTTSCIASASSAPIATCSTSTSARPSPSGGSASGADRWARRIPRGVSLTRRNANASARADAPSSHWTSSIARSVGPRWATSLSTDRNAAPTARSSGGAPSASSRSSAMRSAFSCGAGSPRATSSRTSATMSASPVKARPASASTGRVTSTLESLLARGVDSRGPDGRLADARLPLEHEDRDAPASAVDEPRHRSELDVPTNDGRSLRSHGTNATRPPRPRIATTRRARSSSPEPREQSATRSPREGGAAARSTPSTTDDQEEPDPPTGSRRLVPAIGPSTPCVLVPPRTGEGRVARRVARTHVPASAERVMQPR